MPVGALPLAGDVWVGRLELWPACCGVTWSRLCWLPYLRFLAARADRSCPLDSPTCRLRVYPVCTGPGCAPAVSDLWPVCWNDWSMPTTLAVRGRRGPR
jgi:hypothetical protein